MARAIAVTSTAAPTARSPVSAKRCGPCRSPRSGLRRPPRAGISPHPKAYIPLRALLAFADYFLYCGVALVRRKFHRVFQFQGAAAGLLQDKGLFGCEFAVSGHLVAIVEEIHAHGCYDRCVHCEERGGP